MSQVSVFVFEWCQKDAFFTKLLLKYFLFTLYWNALCVATPYLFHHAVSAIFVFQVACHPAMALMVLGLLRLYFPLPVIMLFEQKNVLTDKDGDM